MDKQRIDEEIEKQAENRGLDCEKAMELAKRLSIGNKEIGERCNELGIKIRNCQLGCFG